MASVKAFSGRWKDTASNECRKTLEFWIDDDCKHWRINDCMDIECQTRRFELNKEFGSVLTVFCQTSRHSLFKRTRLDGIHSKRTEARRTTKGHA